MKNQGCLLMAEGRRGFGYEINRQSLLRNPSFLLTVPITTLTAPPKILSPLSLNLAHPQI